MDGRSRGPSSARLLRRCAGWTWTCMAVVLLSACGLRTDPLPQSFMIPPTQDVRARFREDVILLSWQQPALEETRKLGAVQYYGVSVRRLPLGCAECSPLSRQDMRLRANSPGLTVEGQVVYFQWVPAGEPTQWLIQVRTRFEAAESAPSKPVLIEGVSSVPVHALAYEAMPNSRQVRLYWEPRQERTQWVLTPGGGQVERPVTYRVNVYRRFPPAPWPLSPLNPAPLEALQYLVQPPASSAIGGAGQVEYSIRLMDSFGNEGALAPAVSLSFAAGAPG